MRDERRGGEGIQDTKEVWVELKERKFSERGYLRWETPGERFML